MTDIVNMPNQGDNYLRKGRNAAENLEYQQAIDYFIKSYNLTKSDEALNEIVAYYLFIDQYDALHAFLTKHNITFEAFLVNKEMATFYIAICELVMDDNTGILNLYRLKNAAPPEYELTNLIDTAIERIEAKIAIRNRFAKLASEGKYTALLYQISKQKPFDQLKSLAIIYDLDFDLTEQLLIPLLESDDTVSFVKTNILEYFTKKPIDREIQFHWFDQIVPLNLNTLVPQAENKRYQDTLRAIYEQSEQENPHLTNQIIQQFYTQAYSFYPFIEKVISDPNEWYAMYLYMNGLASDDEVDVNSVLLKYMKKVSQEYIAHVYSNATHHDQLRN